MIRAVLTEEGQGEEFKSGFPAVGRSRRGPAKTGSYFCAGPQVAYDPSMRHGTLVILLCVLLAPAACRSSLNYPQAKRGDVVDDYHGVPVADPYRWMEDSGSADVAKWVARENRLTERFLSAIPARKEIRRRMAELWDYEKYSLPIREGQQTFWFHNDGMQAQDVLFVSDAQDGEARVLLDPNTLSADGTVALSLISPSDDGTLLAYGVAEGGSDWIELRVLDVASGNDLEDRLQWVKFSTAAWTMDGEGFFYSRYDEPTGEELSAMNVEHQLYYHRVGTPQSEDRLILRRPDQPGWLFIPEVSEDGNYLVISVLQGTDVRNRVHYFDLREPDGEIVPLLDDLDARYVFVGNDGPVFWFQTDLDASRGRVIAVDSRESPGAPPHEIIPEATGIVAAVSVVGGRFIVNSSEDVNSVVRIHTLSGALVGELELPGPGMVAGFSGKLVDAETYFVHTSFVEPPAIYRFDVVSGEYELAVRPEVDFDPTEFVTTQVFYPSKDGTRVPMHLTHRRGLEPDGSNPVFLYAYGGGHISLLPSFSVVNQVWMEMGGIYAQANIRGGGEYGIDWWQDGRRENKQNCLDDLLAAGEYLIEAGYTSSKRLAIGGGSNGGLVVAACMLQRPDLFAACLADAGVMDLLRYPEFTIGAAWIHEFGDPNDPEMFEVLRSYSPLHNVRPGTSYPATLISTADRDDRVVPSHSYKFTAALQAAQAGPAPILIHVETRAGHGAGMPTSMIIEQSADKLAFLAKVLGL